MYMYIYRVVVWFLGGESRSRERSCDRCPFMAQLPATFTIALYFFNQLEPEQERAMLHLFLELVRVGTDPPQCAGAVPIFLSPFVAALKPHIMEGLRRAGPCHQRQPGRLHPKPSSVQDSQEGWISCPTASSRTARGPDPVPSGSHDNEGARRRQGGHGGGHDGWAWLSDLQSAVAGLAQRANIR